MSPYLADFRLSLLLLARSRLWVVAGVLAGVLAAVAWLSGQFSPRQPATVALDIGISFIRLAVPLLGLLHLFQQCCPLSLRLHCLHCRETAFLLGLHRR